MPYLTKERRMELERGSAYETGGDLNYMISVFFNQYLRDNGLRYRQLNTLAGAVSQIIFDLHVFLNGGKGLSYTNPSIEYQQLAAKVKWFLMDRPQGGQEALGAVENAWAEFYHCVVRPYEIKKARENGPVYDFEFTTGGRP